MIKSIIKILIALTVVRMEVSARRVCDISEKTADECGRKLIFIGERNTRLPKTDEELIKHCSLIDEGFQCIKKYSKSCLDPLANQIMNIAIKNGDKLGDRVCRDPNGRKELLHHFACVGEADKELNGLHLCMEKFILQMEHMVNITSDHRIAATCCSYHMLDKCTKAGVAKVCPRKETIDYLSKVLTDVTGDLVKTGCGKFNSIARCDTDLDPKDWKTLKDLIASDDYKVIQSKRIYSSPFIALKKVMIHLMDA